jgi:hypothetical protein
MDTVAVMTRSTISMAAARVFFLRRTELSHSRRRARVMLTRVAAFYSYVLMSHCGGGSVACSAWFRDTQMPLSTNFQFEALRADRKAALGKLPKSISGIGRSSNMRHETGALGLTRLFEKATAFGPSPAIHLMTLYGGTGYNISGSGVIEMVFTPSWS